MPYPAWALAILLTLFPVALRAQLPQPASPRPTLADTTEHPIGFHARLPPHPLVFTGLRQLKEPWLWGPVLPSDQLLRSFDSAAAVGHVMASRNVFRGLLLADLYPHRVVDTSQADHSGLFGLSENTADVHFEGQLRFDLSTSRQRNLACTPALAQDPTSGCSGGFTAPQIDDQVVLQSSGVLLQRFHIDVDLDTKRDLATANTISARYVGLVDEKLQAVNVGSVTFQAPQSRFLAATIPVNNFGVSAAAQFGPLRLQGIYATQKGSQVATRTVQVGATTTEPTDKLERDLDYAADQFFWVVDPRTLPGYPSVDALNAGAISLPASQQPVQVRVYRYVAANAATGQNANYDGITALGVNGSEVAGPIRWRLLQAGKDYWLDPSGLWFVMAGKINPSDYLAVSYQTKSGTTVGTFPAADNPARNDTLRLIYLPNRGPSSPVFPYEMRQAYLISGSSLVRSTLSLAVLQGNTERPDSAAAGTFLSLLGLAVPSDPAVLDIDNRIFPRPRDPQASQTIQDAFVIFPDAEPFSDSRLAPSERNDSLYVTPEYLLYSQGPPSKFSLHLRYSAQGGGDRSGVTLDAVQISDGSETVQVNGRQLVRDIDYTIDYTTGRITFLDPNDLFPSGTGTVTVRFAERNFYAIAPTSIAGLTGTWQLGRNNTINAEALYQAEATAFTRPPIGYEPRASLIGGISGDFTFDTPGLTTALNHLVSKRSSAPSLLHLNGELDFSRPDPNRSGAAVLEDFESDGAIPISLGETAWVPGSAPQSGAGLSSFGLGGGFDLADAVQLTWQNLVPDVHGRPAKFYSQDIDPTIVTTTSSTPAVPETVLFMAVHADSEGGQVDSTGAEHWHMPHRDLHPEWRTFTTALSNTGVDLSRNDYLEFWLYESGGKPVENQHLVMVVDLGKVSEDAVALAPDSFQVVIPGDTIWTGRQYVGRGRLDTEKSTFGTWSAVSADTGILGDRPDSVFGPGGIVIRHPALCQRSLGAQVLLFPWGDLGERCTNGNGNPDTEDLDGDNVLDAQGPNENVFRYVLDFGNAESKDSVRSHTVTDSLGHTATWTLYRIPLRTPDDTIGTPDIRLVKQMRVAFVVPPHAGGDSTVHFALARMRLTGAAWAERATTPIAGIGGATAQPHGLVDIGSVSTQNTELGYTSPPGIGNAATTVSTNQNQLAQQINEKSLRVVVNDLQPGERAEGYTRLVAGSQNLLAYRELRVWVRGRGPGWDGGPLQAFVKIGSDAYNFYMYRAPASTVTWDPELVIDLSRWTALREEIENERLRSNTPVSDPACGGDPNAWVACDGPYVVQVRDPQVNPPNLAAVQEISAGIYYPDGGGAAIPETELWVDDIRASAPISQVGLAGTMSAHLVASDVAQFDVAYVGEGGQFRLMGQNPNYQTTRTITSTSTVHLDRFLPLRFGLAMPFTFTTSSGHVTPDLLSGTDLAGPGLSGLRIPHSQTTAWSFSVRRNVKAQRLLPRLLLDPLSLTASGTTGATTTELSDASASAWNVGVSYQLNVARHATSLGLQGLVNGLPEWFKHSTAGEGIARASIAWWPTGVHVASALSRSSGDFTSYAVPIERLSDTILKPVTTEQHLWQNSAGMVWQPLGMLVVTSDWASTRDLRHYADTTSLGRLAADSRQSLFGTDIGVERDRSYANSIGLSPQLASWLRTEASIQTNFVLSRSLASRNPVRIDGDTAGAYILPQTLNNSRTVSLQMSVDPALALRRLFGDSSAVAHFVARMRPVQFVHRHSLQSTYDLATFTPGLDYQLALGPLDQFLTHGGQQAIGVINDGINTVTTSMDFPAGVSASLSYSQTGSNHYQQNGTGFLLTTATSTDWPNGNVSWSETFRGGIINLVRLGSTVERRVTTSSTPLAGGIGSGNSSNQRTVSPNAVVALSNGVNLGFDGSMSRTNTSANGNITQSRDSHMTFTASWHIRLPRLVSKLRRTLQTQLSVEQLNSYTCIQQSSDSTCVPSSDTRHIELRGGFTAAMGKGVSTGLVLGYVFNDIRNLDQKRSVITINLQASIPLEAVGLH